MNKVSMNRIMYFDGFDDDCPDKMSALIVRECLKNQDEREKIKLNKEKSCLNLKYLWVGVELFYVWLHASGEIEEEMLGVLKKIPQFQVFIEYFKEYL